MYFSCSNLLKPAGILRRFSALANPRIAVPNSSDLDSSVAAYLLKSQGYNIVGVYMQNWDFNEEKGYCEGEKDWSDVQKVSDFLKIPCVKINMVKEYWNRVFSVMIDEYQSGITPNPDVLCNQEIKFSALFDKLSQLSLTSSKFNRDLPPISPDRIFFATGHYARTEISQDNTVRLKRASEVGLSTANKKDSNGICFVGERRKFSAFMEDYIKPKPGEIVDVKGVVLGTHNGLHTRTIGQSAGLAINAKPWFVCSKDTKLNRLIAVQGHDHELLFTQKFYISHISWLSEPIGYDSQIGYTANLLCQIRHLEDPVECTITRTESGYNVLLEKRLRGVAPGQYAAFYDGD
ncbi:hypothetical protein BB560_005372, partial [Smittium megazygosporum]